MLFAICPLRESDTQPAAKPPPPYGHALMGVRVLKSDGAIAPRVLKFDSGSAAEGCGGRPYGRQYKCCLAVAGINIQPP